MKCDSSYDVVVVGGGIAGCAAAVSSSRLGARTLLVEHFGFLGGWATAALVNPFMTHCASDGTPLVAGFFSDLREELDRMGGLLANSFDTEVMKTVLLDMVLASGVDLRLHTVLQSAVCTPGIGLSCMLQCKTKPEGFTCKRLVDCSGDGDAAVALGAAFESGDATGLPQAVTLMFDMGGVDLARAISYVRDHPDQMLFPKLEPNADTATLAEDVVSIAGYYDLVAKARASGEYYAPGELIFYVSRPAKGEVVFNTTHIGRVDGTCADDLTHAEIEGRRQMMSVVDFVKKHVPGFEKAFLLRAAAHVGIRETRRIRGDYVFSADDVISARKFSDCVCRLAYPVDVHSGTGKGYTRDEADNGGSPASGAPSSGDWYEIPYRCLLPAGLENVLVAGRCVSSTQAGHGAIRIMPACSAMGQAAGTAAALSIHHTVTPRAMPVELLLQSLRDQGALV